jgi:DNA-binding response OmpR family regulator
MLYNLLRGAGYDAVTVFSPGAALMLAGREQFDLFILETRFRDGNGFELCRSIRETRPGAKVIFYSGDAFETDWERGLDAGARAYVKKPAIEELLDAVRNALGEA